MKFVGASDKFFRFSRNASNAKFCSLTPEKNAFSLPSSSFSEGELASLTVETESIVESEAKDDLKLRVVIRVWLNSVTFDQESEAAEMLKVQS